jgi:hypothetical protein
MPTHKMALEVKIIWILDWNSLIQYN